MSSTRNRTSSSYIGRALYLYFLGLSIRNVAKAMFCFRKVKRSHVLLAKKWKWIQKYHPKKILSKRKRISEFIIDETLLKVGLEFIWLWVVAIEPENRQILALFTNKSKERNMFIAERFLSGVVRYLWNSSCFHRWWHMVSTSL